MKFYKLMILLLLSTNSILGQTTKELFSLPGYEIIMVAINSAEAPDDNMSLYFETDTIMCGESILKYNTSYGENIYLSIIEGKVMVVDSCNSQRLLFDFDVSIGDSIIVNGRNTEVVAIGDTLLNDDNKRKTYSVKAPDGVSPDSELFIEGIGSQFTGLDYTKENSGYSTYFSCINDANGQIHLSPYANPDICDLFSMFTSSTLNPEEAKNITVFPNPTYNEISIIKQSKSVNYLRIINPQGKIVYNNILDKEINIMNTTEFPNGVYYIIISDKMNRIINQIKVVKM